MKKNCYMLLLSLFICASISIPLNGAFKTSSVRLPLMLKYGKKSSALQSLIRQPCCNVMTTKTCALAECTAEFRELKATQNFIRADIKRSIAIGGKDNWMPIDLAATLEKNEQQQVKLIKTMWGLSKKCCLNN